MQYFNLDKIEAKELLPGFHGKFIHTENETFAFWEIEANCSLPAHSHPHTQVLKLLEGEFELAISGQKLYLKTGDVVSIAPNEEHAGRAITRCKIIDTFHPVREDYKV